MDSEHCLAFEHLVHLRDQTLQCRKRLLEMLGFEEADEVEFPGRKLLLVLRLLSSTRRPRPFRDDGQVVARYLTWVGTVDRVLGKGLI